MRLSNCFVRLGPDKKYDPKSYIEEAGIMDCFANVSLTYLPIGNVILKKLIKIIDNEMDNMGAQEIIMPAFVPERSIDLSKNVTHGTYQKIGVYFLKGGEKYYLMPTNEETASCLFGRLMDDFSFKEKAFYHTTRKYRDEESLEFPVRLNEFFMHDVYSFTTDENYIDEYYDKYTDSYRRICDLLELNYYLTTYISDDLLGYQSQEFLAVLDGAKDFFKVVDEKRRIVRKVEPEKEEGSGAQRGLEIAHVYKLYEIFSDLIPKEKRNGHSIYMNGHGMGLDRVLFAVVGQRLKNGVMTWPKSIRPFSVSVIPENSSVVSRADEVYREFQKSGVDVLLDDREGLKDDRIRISESLGIPHIILVGKNSLRVVEDNNICDFSGSIADGIDLLLAA